MKEKCEFTATIVLYKNNIDVLKKTINSFLKINLKKKLYLIDNNADNKLQNHFKHPEIEYVFVGKNIGFAKAQNLILNRLNSKYHLILNPDVFFEKDIIYPLIEQLNLNLNVSFVSPKVLYPDKSLQYICRKNPNIFDLINRKIKLNKKKRYANEYRNKNLDVPFYPSFIQGCFMLFKTADFINIKGFDERYFMYMEDADICRKIKMLNKKIMYFPLVKIIHIHNKSSSKNIKYFIIHLISAIKYFIKWSAYK